MAKHKLQRFAEMDTFPNVFQPKLADITENKHPNAGQWKPNYFKNQHPLVLELGCGKGEYTVGLAGLYPHKNFIGIDIKGARMWRGAKTALDEHLTNVAFVRTKIDMINRVFDLHEVDEIWITFPDPQPRKLGKRLSSAKFLNYYRSLIKAGGIIHLKTDSAELYRYTKAMLELNNIAPLVATENLYADISNDPVLSIKTFYEQSFLKIGKKINYLQFAMPDNFEWQELSKDHEFSLY